MNALSKKTLTSWARMQLALLAMLLIPAWTLAYWQAWLYWALTSAASLLMSLHFLKRDPALMQRRLDVGARAETLPRQKLIQGIGGAFVCAIYVVAAIEHRFRDPHVPAALALAADAAVLIAAAMTFRVFRENTFTAATVTVEAGQRVVATGPYAVVRHPMYTAAMLGYLAAPPALGSLAALVPAVLVCATIIVRLLDEERHLAAHLPGYAGYRAAVRWRLIPRIW
ncbi:MAG TPA: isoprenylcysteine carboxylmethyltransferase family protein [Rhodanobacteraceae bacterium]|nr:isoprenylcysteine carboxylmethyltransferase family protein [Rhodanobacteraceae bacterium]